MTVRFMEDARRLLALAWPVFIGQIAVLGFATVDTVLLARHSALDLAALAVGASAYVTVFIGLMGMVMAVGPIAGQFFGGRRYADAGEQLRQALLLALVLALPAAALLAFPQPFLWLAKAGPDVADRVRGYLLALAVAVPAALLFTAFRGFNTAVSRPKAVMALQLGGLALKVPLSALLVSGGSLGPLDVPALGVTGCGVATAIVMWTQLAAAALLTRRDRFYEPFALWSRGWPRPQRHSLGAQLRLGVPMGLAVLIEVTGFSFMALLISRLAPDQVAGHQIAANLTALLFMMPLSMAQAAGALVAQALGAGEVGRAQALGRRALRLALGIAAVAAALLALLRQPIAGLYTGDAALAASVVPLLAWVAAFHVADAAQAVSSQVLRAWRVATVPVLIYALSLWGVGLGGGWWLGRGGAGPALAGAPGFWAAGAMALVLAALALVALLRHVAARAQARQVAAPG
ncbi:MATE family efflux transporter [Aquabacterium sp. J223]|uniref:MATE family efflux transporter n=1 Tax=Aquabacterium sp. J223 TaxID=2898431 RepID=UPI0021ADA420|nr:MATE family efflux transporter [Aquabacterium sp. J223]UUX94954.1 MATE family efflux transporter [Aquabacterium sp. J223]